MTHDELLDKILMECGCRNTKALRAIVELHKPEEEIGKFCQTEEQCWACDKYPCPTIQAIEKELIL